LLDINVAQIFIGLVVLLFSLTIHEMSHAWTADRLGDPTARLLGRVSLNPLVHADLIGTVIFPLVALTTHMPIIGWAKPVPVNPRRLGHPRRDYVLVAAAGPASNVVMAVAAAIVLAVMHAGGAIAPQTIGETNLSAPLAALLSRAIYVNVLLAVFNMVPIPPLDGGNVLAGLLPYRLAITFNQIRPYGFILLYALILSGGFEYIVVSPSTTIMIWLSKISNLSML